MMLDLLLHAGQTRQGILLHDVGRWKRQLRRGTPSRRSTRFLAKQRPLAWDLEDKISRAVLTWTKECQGQTLVIGDVRGVSDGKRLHAKSQQ